MLFGSKDKFGIEAYLDQPSDRVFIRYCFWVNKDMVGELSQPNLLIATLPVFESMLSNKGKRNCTQIISYQPRELIDILINKIWLTQDIGWLKKKDLTFENFKLLDIGSHQGETFQGFYLFLIESEGYDWILCKDDILDKVIQLKIPKGDFYKTVAALSDWIRKSTMLVLKEKFLQRNSSSTSY